MFFILIKTRSIEEREDINVWDLLMEMKNMYQNEKT